MPETETIQEIINWLFGIFVAANVVVNLTSTPEDDKWLAKIRNLFDFAALNWTAKSKEGKK